MRASAARVFVRTTSGKREQGGGRVTRAAGGRRFCYPAAAGAPSVNELVWCVDDVNLARVMVALCFMDYNFGRSHQTFDWPPL
jgi:hypothetical protein